MDSDRRGAPGASVRHDLDELDAAIEQVEDEYLLRQGQRVGLPHPVPIMPDLIGDAGFAPIGEPEPHTESRTRERTQVFLKNVGAGSTVSLVKIALQLALLPIMAHLLGPKEFGVYALAVPVVGFLAVIADGGIGLSLARDATDSPVIWSTAFWVLMASGIVLSVTVAGAGYLLAAVSSEPQLVTIMLILALSFPFLTLSVVPMARLTRRGNLVAGSIADLISVLASAACAVGLGWLGFGAKALAAQYLTSYAIRAVILNLYAFEKPQAVFRPSTILDHLSSGGILMGGRVADLISRSSENLLFGNAFGAATLGAYNFANQVPRFLFEAFSNPTWVALYAQSLNEQHDRLLKFYYKVCRFMAFVTFPTAAVLAAASTAGMAQVLGEKWLQAGTFLQILAPGYAISSTASMGTALLLALSANKTFFVSIVVVGLGRVVAVALGHYLETWQTVSLVTVSNVVYAVLVFAFVAKVARAGFVSIFKDLVGSFISSVLCGVVCWGILQVAGQGFVALGVAVAAAGVTYLLAMFAIEGKNLKNEFAFLRAATAGIVKKDR